MLIFNETKGLDVRVSLIKCTILRQSNILTVGFIFTFVAVIIKIFRFLLHLLLTRSTCASVAVQVESGDFQAVEEVTKFG